MRALALAGMLWGCSIEHSLIPCGELLCPRGTVCTPNGCVEAESAGACADRVDGDACTTASIADGTCNAGACHEVACGNGILDRDEACDDGNQAHEDGCSADCRSNETCGNGIADVLVGEECDVGVPSISSDGCTSTCLDEIETWRHIEPTGPGPRSQPSMTYDSDRNVLVIFGGFDTAAGYYGDTWEWDTFNWLRRIPGRSPTPRAGAAIAYDPVRRRTVLFGGTDGTRNAETWLWDGVAWTQASPAMSPTARSGAKMAWDPDRARIVLLGGFDGTTNLGDTWEWDGTTWALGVSTSVFTGRGSFGITYDYALDKLVAHCGQGNVGMHEWTGTAWAQIASSAMNRDSLVLASDSVNNRIVMFGGMIGVAYQNDTFVWQGTSWSTATQPVVPSARAQHAMSFHAGIGQVVMFGGVGSGGRLSDLWVLTASAGWEQKPDVHPPTRRLPIAIYDPLRGTTLLNGGIAAGQCFTPRTDQWLWDGFTWKRTGPPLMPNRYAHAGAFDGARGVIVVYGGISGCAERDDTWLWNGTAWSATTPSTKPPPRSGHAMAYDAARGVVIMFGGAGVDPNNTALRAIYGETWAWNGTDWTVLSPATAPVPRERHVAAYDARRERVVIHGGLVDGLPSGETWEWDGTSWSMTSSSGPVLTDAAMTYDPMRGLIVLWGGLATDGTASGETWEWDGVTWRRGTPLDRPAGRVETAIAYDAIRRQLVMFGGLPGFTLFNVDAWARTFESVTTPREVCLRADEDADGDGLAGCADPDCFGRCAPLCPPGVACPPTAARCGDQMCGPVEDYLICPTDCAAP